MHPSEPAADSPAAAPQACVVCGSTPLPPSPAGRALCLACETGETRSPCTGRCELSRETGACVGCLRTPDEIQGWGERDRASRAATYARIARRRVGSPARADGTVRP